MTKEDVKVATELLTAIEGLQQGDSEEAVEAGTAGNGGSGSPGSGR